MTTGIDLVSAVPLDASNTGGFGVRLLSRLTDWIISMIAGLAAGVLIGIARALQGTGSHYVRPGLGFSLASGIICAFAGETTALIIAGTSIGKLLFGYRVVSIARNEPCTVEGAIKRTLALYVDGLFMGFVAFNEMADSPLHQRIGDRWGGTVVAKSSALPASAKQGPVLVASGLILDVGMRVAIVATFEILRLL